ncbi:MAG: VOC family protein [Gammaproteobacteria bacterium]|nr:VOC family protein [Gammaproteobacteria bacterium]MBU2057242.1 VOC family protein [Gammaproteobacteria bacterium]MBU2174844.1 VOC family protein [Gammaproteobacteria bacterium]MBU2245449.1 VOC family protein [Gammaproteobacteria bacterium]MBU2344230.1 VOC family protein [Gammaproteobacteria bacterium]
MDLNQVTLPVKDMDKAVQFYLIPGFTQIVDTPHYARFACPDGDSTFSLSLEQDDFENHSVIYFEHENLEELCQQLSQKGIRFEQQPSEQRYLWKEAILKDPSGNKIKLYRAGENRLNPPWKVGKGA